jgi:hypothetical protein
MYCTKCHLGTFLKLIHDARNDKHKAWIIVLLRIILNAFSPSIDTHIHSSLCLHLPCSLITHPTQRDTKTSTGLPHALFILNPRLYNTSCHSAWLFLDHNILQMKVLYASKCSEMLTQLDVSLSECYTTNLLLCSEFLSVGQWRWSACANVS